MSPDVAIVGAGITGCATAYELSKFGLKVQVFEKYFPAAMASGWTLAGIRQSGRHRSELPLALYSIKKWQTLSDELDYDIAFTQNGNLRLARDLIEEAMIEELVQEQKLDGLDIIHLSNNKEIKEIAPLISDDIHSASFCATDGHADPIATVNAYKLAAERNNCTFCLGETVEKLKIEKGRLMGLETSKRTVNVNICLLTGGVLTNNLLADTGTYIPFSTPIVSVIQTEPMKEKLHQVIGVGNGNLSLRQEKNGTFRISSGAQKGDYRLIEKNRKPQALPSLKNIHSTLGLVFNILPILKTSLIKNYWGGILDLTPDGLPVLDRVSEVEGLVVGAGFSGHGFGTAPANSHILSNIVLGVNSKIPFGPFSLERLKAT